MSQSSLSNGTRRSPLRHGEYLQDDVALFSRWLAERLSGQPIDFAIAAYPAAYPTLQDALNDYNWPPRKISALVDSAMDVYRYPASIVDLPGRSGIVVNSQMLKQLQRALHDAYSRGNTANFELAGAVAAILNWGGVYATVWKTKGNKPWLAANHLGLYDLLKAVVQDHARGEDQSRITDLRFNSGMTKVYSLLIDDFIIYDSRVAAALAWLVITWWRTSRKQSDDSLPLALRFGCLPANGKGGAFRNPQRLLFPTLRSCPARHYTWNMRANWLLGDALKQAGSASHFSSLRDIEAALFQMGARVSA